MPPTPRSPPPSRRRSSPFGPSRVLVSTSAPCRDTTDVSLCARVIVDLIDSSSDHLTMSGQHMTEIGSVARAHVRPTNGLFCSRVHIARFERSEKALGAGAFGKVWLGLRDNGEFLAIKEIQIAPNEKYAQRLEAVENEIELMRSLDHPHIVVRTRDCARVCTHCGGLLTHACAARSVTWGLSAMWRAERFTFCSSMCRAAPFRRCSRPWAARWTSASSASTRARFCSAWPTCTRVNRPWRIGERTRSLYSPRRAVVC